HRMIAPQPAHHLRHHHAPLLLAVPADAPGVADLVALLGQRLHQGDVLVEPVAPLIVGAAAPDAAIVVAAILHEDADRLLLALADDLGIGVAAADVREAADDAEHLVEVVRPLPGHGECGNRAGTGTANAVSLRVLR